MADKFKYTLQGRQKAINFLMSSKEVREKLTRTQISGMSIGSIVKQANEIYAKIQKAYLSSQE